MSETDPQAHKPEIHTDEDWKARVKAEDAKRDAEAAAQKAPAEAPKDESQPEPGELPAASFMTLLQMLSTQAVVALGMIPSPNGETTVQLPLAQHFIDLLSIIESKTQGNLTSDEQRFLEGTLHELRMAFVAVSKQQSKS